MYSSDDRVACRFVVTGTHTVPFSGMPATGRRFTLRGVTIQRFLDSRCVERCSQADVLSQLQQLGAMPAKEDESRRGARCRVRSHRAPGGMARDALGPYAATPSRRQRPPALASPTFC